MRLLQQQVTQNEVWDHWKRIENHISSDFRHDIRQPLPPDMKWMLCEIEPQDLDHLFIISSDDWSDISGGTFRVRDVGARLDNHGTNQDSINIANNIHSKMNFLESGQQLDSKLILVTNDPSLNGPFTLIEGNKRSVTFYLRNTLAGISVFVGLSPKIVNYFWARHTYRRLK